MRIGRGGSRGLLAMVATAAVSAAWGQALGYPGGPLIQVTDVAPMCAGCHSSMQREQLRELPAEFAARQMVETKHYEAIKTGAGPYKDLSPQDRDTLLADIKLMDEIAAVNLTAPGSIGRGQTMTVTAKVRGGAGPVVGVVLLDNNLRYQSRPIAGDGWMILGAPRVIGPDGKEQTRWTDRREAGLRKNLNFVLVFDVKSDLAKRQFPEAQVTWTVRAPGEPGQYTLAVAFMYGTEKASPLGAVQTPTGIVPRGGGGAPSGHLRFSDVKTITVN